MKEQTELAGKPKDDLRAMKVLVAAILIGVVVFTLIMVFVTQLTKAPSHTNITLQTDNYSFSGIVAIIGSASIVVAMFLYRKRVISIKQSGKSLTAKLKKYRTALILYLAICEVAAFLSVLFFFFTGNFAILIITGLMLIMMLSKMPSTKKVIGELSLDWKEQQELE